MGNALRIYSGPGDISLYDATNGVLHLGYNKDISVEQDPMTHELLDGNIHQYASLTKLNAPLLQTDSALMDAIKARRSTKQEVTIVGFESALRIKNVFPAVAAKRPYKGGEAHSLQLTAQTSIEDDVVLIENLLGDKGNMNEPKVGDPELADGWETNAVDYVLTTSPLPSGGLAQYFDNFVATNYFRTTVSIPFRDERVLTFSAYLESSPAEQIRMRIELMRADQTVFQTFDSELIQMTTQIVRRSFRQIVTPNEAVYDIRVSLRYAGSAGHTLTVDNAQLELGSLSGYVENPL